MTDFLPYVGDVLAGVASSESAERRQMFDQLLQTAAQSAWGSARTQVESRLKEELGAADRIAPGVSLYDIDLQLAEKVSLARSAGGSSDAGEIPMELRLGPDSLKATSTTPSVFGSYADPAFSLYFGIIIDFSIEVQPERMSLSLSVGSAHLTSDDFTGNPHFHAENVVADLAELVAGTISPWFGGPNYVALVESLLGKEDFSGVLNAALQPVNDLLGELAKEGMGTVTALFPDAQLPGGLSPKAVALDGQKTGGASPLLVLAQPLLGDGVVRGQIRWPQSAGAPALDPPYADAFRLSASVPTGAAVGEFSQPTEVGHVESLEHSTTDTDHVLTYSLAGLPIGKPVTVECTANGSVQWTGDAAAKIPMTNRAGWEGAVTINPAIHRDRPVSAGLGESGPGAKVELNPQPIPPGRPLGESVQRASEDRVALNPQPIPPGRPLGESVQRASEERVALNPQPIPPGHSAGLRSGVGLAGEHEGAAAAATVQQQPARENPTGAGEVDGIDFVVEFAEKPR